MKIKFRYPAIIFCFVFLAGCADVATRYPKNVIIFVADGAGFNHFRAANYYECNQSQCQLYAQFPVRLAMSTYPASGSYDANLAQHDFNYVKINPTDSAAAATAMATGIKSYNAAIGVDVNGKPVLNLLERAEQLGKSTGIVTSVPFSHATPAGFVAHNTSRDNYTQIAYDMLNKSAVDVIMGCGHPFYNNDGRPISTPQYSYISSSVWSMLINGSAGADCNGDGVPDPWMFIQTRAELQKMANGPTPKRVCAIPQVFETLQQKRSGNTSAGPYEVAFAQTVPTLEEMTRASLNILDNDPDGFFLMIEGGAIDWASHSNQSGRLIEEMNDFNLSIKAVYQWVNRNSNWGETLVIIIADHETGNLTGPDFGEIIDKGQGKLPIMEWHCGLHTNSLVPFFAKGRGAEQFKNAVKGYDAVHGPYIDNTDIARVIFSLWRD